MSWHPALLSGLAQRLDAEGLGVYREDGFFQPGERGIVVQTFPETPAEIIALALYLPGGQKLSPTAGHELASTRVQIRYRLTGHPFTGIELFDRLRSLIDAKTLRLGAVTVNGAYRSFRDLGEAASGREFTSNWEFTGLASL